MLKEDDRITPRKGEKVTGSTNRAKVVKVRDLSPSIRELVLSPVGHRISFKPGQWVSLHLPVGKRPPLVRAYSMAEPESPSGSLVLVFDRVPGGLGSGYLFSLREGDEIVLAGSFGRFVVPEPVSQDLLLIARYTGIVPVRCIIRHLFASKCPRVVTLIYGGPAPEEYIYQQEFLDLAARDDHFRFLPVAAGAGVRDPGDCRHETEMIGSIFKDRRDYLPMICGVKAFVSPLRAYFSERGFGRREVRHENYD